MIITQNYIKSILIIFRSLLNDKTIHQNVEYNVIIDLHL